MLHVTNSMYFFRLSRSILCRREQLVISVIGILILCRYSTSSIKSGLLVGSPPSIMHQTQYLDTLSKTIFHCCVVRSDLLANAICSSFSGSPKGHIGQKKLQ